MTPDGLNDVAVVGIGLRFPGNASNPEELWRVLEQGESQWSEFPQDRLNIDGYYHPSGDRQGSISFRGAHFLRGDIGAFDAPFFSTPAEDAKAIDPQQRLLLEVTYEAVENAGIRKEDLDGSDTAVYVGSFVKDYEQICLRDPDWQPQYAATGNGIAIMANRISYFFNLHGPSVTVDTGCSGSLVAVHMAAQSIRTGESSLAIAAGAGLILTPNTIMPMTALNFLSPDGKCFSFDSRANGYGRGEGIGVVVLKRLSDAIRDNDSIRAVIRGSKVNQDGRTKGITLPSKEAQVANIRSAYASARLDFNQTAYVECHGTGTKAGDWRELKAISETLSEGRSSDNPILVGSIKANTGHLEGSAGVAGLIKGILMLERGQIPPNINFEKGNPDIDFTSWKVKVPTKIMEWPLPGLRRVSVNCFGFGGTNAHVILDQAPVCLASRSSTFVHSYENDSNATCLLEESAIKEKRRGLKGCLTTNHAPQIFCYSARDRAGVDRIADMHAQYLDSLTEDAGSLEFLSNYSYTLSCRRSVLEWKTAVVASSLTDLKAKLPLLQSTKATYTAQNSQPRVCFVFCGQGAQWAQIGKELLAFEDFRYSLQQAALYMRLILGSPFDLFDFLFRSSCQSEAADPLIAQPATTALQVALVDLLNALGVLPSHVVGHSSGEIAAAYAAGAITRQAAWEIAFFRGAAASFVSSSQFGVKGGMMAVGMERREAEQYLDATKRPVQIACVNSPFSVTLSGPKTMLQEIADDMQREGVFCRILKVRVAYHSSHMKLARLDYQYYLGSIQPRRITTDVRMFSTLTGGQIHGPELHAAYWAQNLVSPVQYLDAVQTMMSEPAKERPNVFVELSPSTGLRSCTADIFSDMQLEPAPSYLSVLDRKNQGCESLLTAIAGLWERGCPVDMCKVISARADPSSLRLLVDLPSYPWNHDKSYWHESHQAKAVRFRKYGRQDLIGAPTADSTTLEPRWRGFLRMSENPWIQDHQVQKTAVYPAAGMLCMVLEGARQLADSCQDLSGFEITNVRLEKAMVIPSTSHGLEVTLNLRMNKNSRTATTKRTLYEFSIYSKLLDKLWERHATGELCMCTVGENSQDKPVDDGMSGLCTQEMVPRHLYDLLDSVGMNYGPLFQNITALRRGNGVCTSTIRVPDTKSKMPAQFEYPHLLHPATLDSMFQTLFAIDTRPMVPVSIKRLFVSADIAEPPGKNEFTGHATAERVGVGTAEADITMRRADQNKPCVVVQGLGLQELPQTLGDGAIYLPNHRKLCTEIVWKPALNTTLSRTFTEQIDLVAHKFPGLEILQIGGGWDLVEQVLSIVAPAESDTPRLARYTLAQGLLDLAESSSEVLSRVQNSRLESYIESKTVDTASPLGAFHLVILSGCSCGDLGWIVSRLAPGSLILELGDDSASEMANDDESQQHPISSVTDTSQTISSPKKIQSSDSMAAFAVQRACLQPSLNNGPSPDVVILTPDDLHFDTLAFIDGFHAHFRRRYADAQVSSMVASAVTDNAAHVSEKVVISLLDFTGNRTSGCSIYNWSTKDFDTFRVLQKSAKAVLWFTRGAHMHPDNPHGAPTIALARTLMSEDPLQHFVTFDLAARTHIGDSMVVEHTLSIFDECFVANYSHNTRETEYAEKDGQLYIPRLQPLQPMNDLVENEQYRLSSLGPSQNQSDSSRLAPAVELQIQKVGLSKDCISQTTSERPDLARLDIEVEFEETMLTHRDIDTAYGRTNEIHVGMDVRGKISRVGDAVTDLKIGDKVVGVASRGALKSVTRVHSQLTIPHRPDLVPSFLIIAYYGLVHIGRARKGRSVLVHGGATAHGLYAVQLAQSAGCDVIATVLGARRDRQRETLRTLGLSDECIIDVDTEGFAPIVRGAAYGQGVDVVFSATEEHSAECSKRIRKNGTWVHVASNRHDSESGNLPVGAATMAHLNLAELLEGDQEFVIELLQSALQFVESWPLDFLPCLQPRAIFGLNEVDLALRCLDATPYHGFVSVRGNFDQLTATNAPSLSRMRPLYHSVDPNGTYLLAGGLGGLGRSIAELLVGNGARHLAFLSRSGAQSDEAQHFLASLASRSIDSRVYLADLCDQASMEDAIGRLSLEMPSIKGVFQCAAVIKDAVFDNMTYTDWKTAFDPKAKGSWNLVQSTLAADHDPFFIFLSSSAGVIGNRGQANYAAGNCFEDAMARYCRSQGRHAVSIDLGPVLGAGMLEHDSETMGILRASGFYSIRHDDFLKVVTHAITDEMAPGVSMPPQVILGVGTGGLIRQNKPADPYWSRTALYSYLNLVDMPPPDLTQLSGAAADEDAEAVLARCADTESAADVISTRLTGVLAKLLNMLPEEMDTGKTPSAYGVDSLVAVGVRNCVFGVFGVEVSVFEVLGELTIRELSMMIAERGGYGSGGSGG